MSDWSLGIDFGTSFTVAAVAENGGSRVIAIESDGSDRMPSSVFVTEDGEILVGRAAQHQAVFAPERYEPTPKRSLGEGELFLGDDLVAVADLAAAVLRRAYTEACRQQGERAPTNLRVTYPADWAQARRSVLLDACQRAGMGEVQLAPEPVAAAVRIALDTPPGKHIAVYDFGGGTFDAAVLLRTADGFEVAGPPVGRDPLGGEDIDRRIIGYLGGLLAEQHPDEWGKLLDPPDVEWRRSAAELRAQVQQAKETLSEVAACQLWIPGINREVQLTRAEFEDLIGEDVDATADAMAQALTEAGLVANDLAGLYLVGGSSRIPLVADTLWRRLGIRPAVQDNPKSIVATGAAVWTGEIAARAAAAAPPPMPEPVVPVAPPAPAPPAPVLPPPLPPPTAAPAPLPPPRMAAPAAAPPPPPAAPRAAVDFRPRLAMACDLSLWPAGYRVQARLAIDNVDDAIGPIRGRDDPADGDTAALAHAVLGARTARTAGFVVQSTNPALVGGQDGIERSFTMTVDGRPRAMFEQYLVSGGRALVIAFPAQARAIADSMTIVLAPAGSVYQSRLALELAPGWSASEKLNLSRLGTEHSVTSERIVFAAAGEEAAWRQAHDAALRRLPKSKLVSRTPSRLFNGAADGEIMTISWRRADGMPMITRLGIGVAGGEGLSLSITLPHAEQSQFAALAAHASLSA